MKKRIEQLLNGIFEYEPSKLMVLPQKIQQICEPDSIVHGSFRIEGEDGRKIRGLLYSPSPRIICNPMEFQGTANDIQYQIDCSGLKEGMEESGVITICSDHGEYTIPYQFRIEQEDYEPFQIGIKSLQELAELAQKNFQKAYRIFISKEFRSFLKEKEPQWLGLYDGFGVPSYQYQSLEEFLVDAGQKDAMELSVSKKNLQREKLTEPIRETIKIMRSTWGFQKISIDSDAAFIRPEKNQITTDEFAGSTYDLNFVIDTNLMHAGRNYARIRLATPVQTLNIEVMAHKEGMALRKGRQTHICKSMQKKLEGLYINFRLGKIDKNNWIERSCGVIDNYKRAGGTDPFADLFLVQLYFADGRKTDAFALLEEVEALRSRLNTPERYAFCLYISTFFYQEASYVKQVEQEISKLFYRNKTSWKLQWILMYLKEELHSTENAKYEVIEEQFRFGCRSRIMFLEAYEILKKNPFLMHRLGAFEQQLLRFAVKENVLTAEVFRHAVNLALHEEVYSKILYDVLTAGYEKYPSEDLVKAICSLLIKGGKKEADCFKWYEKGVSYGLRITGLYEYYMETMDSLDLQNMPQIIRMYFAYDTTLDCYKRAAIYRRIIENKETDPQSYHNYREAMEKFALDQLEAMRISEDLSVLYEKYIKRAALTSSAAEKLVRLLFSFKVTPKADHIKKVIVHSTRVASEQIQSLEKGSALVQVYDPESVILVEDDQGNRYQASLFCDVIRVFENEDMLEWCAEKIPEFFGLVLSVCVACHQEGIVNRNSLPYFRKACKRKELSEEFRNELRKEVIHYYVAHPRDESLPEFLDEIPYLDYIQIDKTSLIMLLAEDGRCSDAFALLDAYGAEGIPTMQLVRICSRMILDLEFEENTMLTALCFSCFAQGKYDDKLLRYMLLYYEGPVQEMKDLWEAAQKFELDTILLEEKLMMLLLFTRSGTVGSEPVFEAYLAKMGRKRLCRAYVNLKAYEYFVKGLPVAESVFRFMEKEYAYFLRKERLEEQEEICRLALLRYYSRAVSLEPSQKAYVQELLAEFGAKGMRFAFWQQFDEVLLAPYQMEGRVFVEYVTDPDYTVHIYYRILGKEEHYTKETVKNYFGGVFVKEFTLFYGEELECYLEIETEKGTEHTDKRRLHGIGFLENGTSRFSMLNRISKAVSDGENEKAWEETESYLMLEYLAKEVFTLV